MGKILDLIIGNTFVFIGVIGILIAVLVAIVLSIVKSFNKHKIPIYEEINENVELENAKEENVIEKPVTKEEKIEAPKEVEVQEELEDGTDIETEEPEEIEEESVEETAEEEISESEEDEEVEFDDEALREELEKIEDKEIEERIDEEHKKNIDEEIKENDNEEIKEILSGMKDTNEVDPEEVVRNFEEEQEAQSIISYQELVNVVKNRENDFDDELESRPLATVSDFIKKDKTSNIEPEANVLDMIEKLDHAKKKEAKEETIEEIEDDDAELEDIEVLEVFEVETKEELDEEKEILPEIPEEGRFKKTDVISPVFGRITEKNKIDYPKVEKFDRRLKKEVTKDVDEIDEDVFQSVMPDFSKIEVKATKKGTTSAEEEMKAVSAMFDSISTKVEEKDKTERKDKKERRERKAGNKDLTIEEDDDSIESLSAISKNEDFLKALRDFRNSL